MAEVHSATEHRSGFLDALLDSVDAKSELARAAAEHVESLDAAIVAVVAEAARRGSTRESVQAELRRLGVERKLLLVLAAIALEADALAERSVVAQAEAVAEGARSGRAKTPRIGPIRRKDLEARRVARGDSHAGRDLLGRVLHPIGFYSSRIVVAGGPRTGKTTYAGTLTPHPLHTDVLVGTVPWSGASEEVAEWFDRPGPWVVEGVAAVRALRKWLAAHPTGKPCDSVRWLAEPKVSRDRGQETMAKGCETIWAEVLPLLRKRGVTIVHGLPVPVVRADARGSRLPDLDEIADLSDAQLRQLIARLGLDGDAAARLADKFATASERLIGRKIPDDALIDQVAAAARRAVRQSLMVSAKEAIRSSTMEKHRAGGRTQMIWISVLDDGTCVSCEDRHGESRPLDAWETIGMPGSRELICNGNCRCELSPDSFFEAPTPAEVEGDITVSIELETVRD